MMMKKLINHLKLMKKLKLNLKTGMDIIQVQLKKLEKMVIMILN